MLAIEELIHFLQVGTVEQKCEAAERLGQLDVCHVRGIDALVAALTDSGEATVGAADEGVVESVTYFVREYAVRALAKLHPPHHHPPAFAPFALQVMGELNGKEKGRFTFMNMYFVWKVSFSAEEVAAFGLGRPSEIGQGTIVYGGDRPQPRLGQRGGISFAVDEFSRLLQVGTVEQKCEAAKRLGHLGGRAIQATDALVAALSDLGEEEGGGAGDGSYGRSTHFVRDYAVRALAKVNPTAAAPLAIQVMVDLNGKRNGYYGSADGHNVLTVSFTPEEVAAFGPAAVEALSTSGRGSAENAASPTSLDIH